MKEDIFDVLIYIFENYLDDDIELLPDSDEIKNELVQAGFEDTEVNNAFDWLEGLSEQSIIQPCISSSFRIFSYPESIKLDIECRNFLLSIEQAGILTPTMREIVIDRAMAINKKTLSLEEMQWTILMVLLSHSDDDIALSRMEDIVYELTPALLH